MKYPTWQEFNAKYSDNPQGAFEALCRLLFRNRFGIGDSLPYFYNNAGNETVPVSDGKDVVGFQAKFFSGETIDDSNATQIKHSIEYAHKHYPNQTKIIVYTNLVFGNPPAGEKMTARQKDIENTAKANSLNVEWMFGNNILDIVANNELAYDLFFNLTSNIGHLQKSIGLFNELNFGNVDGAIKFRGKAIELDRSNHLSRLKELLIKKSNVLISGESGSGKTAITKLLWEQIKNNDDSVVLFFPAQQLDVSSVNDIFVFDENYSFSDFKNFYAGFENKVLIIDSAEKILEQNNIIATKIVLSELPDLGWQFVFTCKNHAAKELEEKLGSCKLATERIDLDLLSADELSLLCKQNGIAQPKNEKVRYQIRIPFYLARYCEINDCDLSSLSAFREKVWNQKVRGTVRGAEQTKREECLLRLVKEQQEKGLYVANPDGFDWDMAYKLVEEDILVEHIHKGFSVKHDIYIDWALDYMVDRELDSAASMEKKLGTPPVSISYANSFKRWLDGVIDQRDNIIDELMSLYFSGKIHQKWEYYILSGIGASEVYAKRFFQKYDDKLVGNDYRLFNRFVDVLEVACQVIDQTFSYKGEQYHLTKPVGTGWDEAVLFVDVHKEDYYMNHLNSILTLLNTYSRLGSKGQAARQAGLLSLRLFNAIATERQKGEYFWIEKPKPWSELVCKYVNSVKVELNDIINAVVANKWTRHTDPYAELVEYIIKEADQMSLFSICLHCNESILKLLNLFWLEQPDDGRYYGVRHSGFDSEYVFGLNADYGIDMGYFPVSALQTPLYSLLSTEHLKNQQGTRVLEFVVDFVNRCIENYEKRNKYDTLRRIKVILPNGEEHEVVSSQSLWNLYRGTPNISMPHVLECMHMAVESYLLSLLSDEKINDERTYVENVLWMFLNKSRSVSLYSIAASIAVAYPDEFFDILLFLCQDIKFISMDLTRQIGEFHAGGIEFAYLRHPLMLEERRKSNKLPHRQNCLETMLFKSQVVYDQYKDNESKERLKRAFAVVEGLRVQIEELKDEDSTYKFIFERLDYSSMEKEEVELEGGQKGIRMTPHSTPEMEKERNELYAMANDMGAMSLRVWADKKYKNEGKPIPEYQFDKDVQYTLRVIRAVEEEVKNRKGAIILLPGDEYVHYIGSAVLLMYYSDSLSKEERRELWAILMEALAAPKAMLSNSMSEIDICLAALPYAMEVYPEKEDFYAQLIASYVAIKEENVNKRMCDIMSQVITKNDLWHSRQAIMEEALDIIQTKLPERDLSLMNDNLADTVLCLLTYKTERRDIGLICIEKLSYLWKKKEEGQHFFYKNHVAECIAMYVLHAPKEEVLQLVAPFVKLVGSDRNEEPLVTSFLICAEQYKKYDNFWMVWYAFYQTITERGGWYYQEPVLNSYLFNPQFLLRDYDNWFKLEEKDMAFFEKVVNDIGSNPTVIYAFARVFATIGMGLQKQAVGLFAKIIDENRIELKDEKETVIFYLLKIVKKVKVDYGFLIKSDQSFKKCLVSMLGFLVDNGSTEAQTIMSTL